MRGGTACSTPSLSTPGKGTLIAPLEPILVEQGKTATRPKEPKKTDRPFMEKDIALVDWYADEGFKAPFDFATTPITSDTTLYARYVYLISTEDQLKAIASGLKGLYRLQNDIGLKTANWTPIGSDESNTFTSRAEGEGYVIKNLKINSSTTSNLGLFGIVGGGGIVQGRGAGRCEHSRLRRQQYRRGGGLQLWLSERLCHRRGYRQAVYHL